MSPARLSAHERMLRLVTEDEFQAQIVQLARLTGWLVYHSPRNMPRVNRSGQLFIEDITPGFPDLVLVRRRDERALFRELKRETERPTSAQMEWIVCMTAAGLDAGWWRPSDWPEIEATLK